MFPSKTARTTPPAADQNTLSIVGSGMTIDGNVAITGDIHIDGTITGNIVARQVTVGAHGLIKGQVKALDARIHGTIEGDLLARVAALKTGAVITGDISYEVIEVEQGAQIDGRLRKAAYTAEAEDGQDGARRPTLGVLAGGKSEAA